MILLLASYRNGCVGQHLPVELLGRGSIRRIREPENAGAGDKELDPGPSRHRRRRLSVLVVALGRVDDVQLDEVAGLLVVLRVGGQRPRDRLLQRQGPIRRKNI